jgi:sterol desaturase/sphingolipid hydroxylase (fatty acid hydroxylase superfamily)
MSIRDLSINVGVIVATMAIAALIETAVPMFIANRSKHPRRRANLGLTVLSFASNWLLASVAALAAVWLRPSGVLAGSNWPMWAQVLVGIVTLDFSVGYLSHRTMHMWSPMWRFHQVHHSDDFVDVTTTYRTHPVETAWRFMFAIVPVWLLGLPAQAVIIQRLLQATNGVIEHANIRVWAPLDRVLSLVWVTPNVHKIHHSRQVAETNSNYANLLTVYDRLLGTYTPAARAETIVYGLNDTERLAEAPLPGLLTLPFESDPMNSVSDRKVRLGAGIGR